MCKHGTQELTDCDDAADDESVAHHLEILRLLHGALGRGSIPDDNHPLRPSRRLLRVGQAGPKRSTQEQPAAWMLSQGWGEAREGGKRQQSLRTRSFAGSGSLASARAAAAILAASSAALRASASASAAASASADARAASASALALAAIAASAAFLRSAASFSSSFARAAACSSAFFFAAAASAALREPTGRNHPVSVEERRQ